MKLDGIYRTYRETSTTDYDYHAVYVTWVDRSKGQGTFTEGYPTLLGTSQRTYTTFQEHTQDSLNQYTKDYGESRTSPMPDEKIISDETTYMAEGQRIVFRPFSTSDGTPVVEIHGDGSLKPQKIHFVP